MSKMGIKPKHFLTITDITPNELQQLIDSAIELKTRGWISLLKNAGFKVIELHNANLDEMRRSITDFSEQLVNYEVGLVYYSGHGIEFSGRNYFIPVNANIKTEDEIPRQGFDVTEIVEKMSRNNLKTSIFIIDACRNAPVFSKFRSPKTGLTSMQVSNGSIVAFSAAPGQVAIDGNGRNSPYTKALLQQIQIPNKKKTRRSCLTRSKRTGCNRVVC